jgi:hypothetical protein
MFGQSAFGSTAPTFGAASTAPAFGSTGTTTGMFGQAGGAFGAQKPAFGTGTTFGGTTGEDLFKVITPHAMVHVCMLKFLWRICNFLLVQAACLEVEALPVVEVFSVAPTPVGFLITLLFLLL